MDRLVEAVRETRGEGAQVLLQPAEGTCHDHLVKLKRLALGALDHDLAGLRRGLPVNLQDARLILDVGAVDGGLGNLIQNLVVRPHAKEILCNMSAQPKESNS